MTRRLDIDSLRALQAVAAQGGVTRAAEALSLSQSAVSHKIKRLEENLGCALLRRRAGAPLLTASGERLLRYAGRILALHDEALQALSPRSLSGRIRLGMTEDTTSSGLASILGRFTRLFPEVQVRTRVAQSLTLEQELADGLLDVAVMQVFARDRRPGDVTLSEDRLVWVKAIDLELTSDRDAPLPFLSYDDDCFYKRWMLEQESAAGRAVETVLQCSSNAGVIAAIEAGLGVAIMNRRHATAAMEILTEGFVQPPDIAYVVRPATRSKPVAALTAEIEREVCGRAAGEAA